MSLLERLLGRGAPASPAGMPLYFFNTLGKEKQAFSLPQNAKYVRMYNCGPTVYARQHIGNLSMFVFADTLRRVLEYNGYEVKQVINFTDVGHLSSDQDEGEDKMSKGLRQEGLPLTLENMRTLGEKYGAIFLEDLRSLGIDTSRIEFPRASDYIAAEIAMVQALEEKGYAYAIEDGVYFDTSRFPSYGELGGIDLEGLKEGARVEVVSGKRQATDFALWKFDEKLGWDSPWGKGFPGWHIECSAMINAVLGKQIDIHTGGIEHIPVHHNNEIAQSESATGKRPLSRFWLHRAHVQIEGSKIAKSEGNVIYLSDIIERGYSPLALRYLFLGAHYRSPSNFSFEALEASQNALARLAALRLSIKEDAAPAMPERWRRRFLERINDDLDTPGALAVLWEMTKDETLSQEALLAGLVEFDKVLGLGLANPDADLKKLAAREFRTGLSPAEVPPEIRALVEERDLARQKHDFARADDLRSELEEKGFVLEDGAGGTRVFRK